MCSSSAKKPKSQLAAEQPAEYWIPPKKDTPHEGQRRSSNKTVGGVQSCLKSDLIPTRDARRVQTKPRVHQNPGKVSTRD